MSDDSISQGVVDGLKSVKDEALESTKSAISPKNILKTLIGHAIGKNLTADEEAKKAENEIKTQQRRAEIEAEMARIAKERESLTGPQIPDAKENTEGTIQPSTQTPRQDLAVTLAQTKGETGRGAKG